MLENKEYIAAIDLGTNSVVTVIGARKADGRIEVASCIVKDSQGVSRGEIKNIELVAASLKEALGEVEQHMNVGIEEAYAGISGQHIRCQRQYYHTFVGKDLEITSDDVRMLNDTMRNVQAAVGEKIIEIIPQNYLVDDEETEQPVGMYGKKLAANFNFIIGDNEYIGRVGKAFDRVGVKQMKLHLNALAAAEAVTTPEERELGVAVVDIGGGTTDVCIYHENQVRYLTVIPLGGSVINKDICTCGILVKHTEGLKTRFGSAYSQTAPADKYVTIKGRSARDTKEISLQQLSMIIEARMMDLIEFVIKEIENSGYAQKLRGGIVLTGGGAKLKDIELLFNKVTGMEVRIGDPTVNVTEETAGLVSDPVCSTAVGLLIRSFEEGAAPTRMKRVRHVVQGTIQGSGPGAPEASGKRKGEDTDDESPKKSGKKQKKGMFDKLGNFFDKVTKRFDDVIDETEI